MATHGTWAALIHRAWAVQARERSGLARAARSHRATRATRMTTYPPTIVVLCSCQPCAKPSNRAGMPVLITRTPTIWVATARRTPQSSVSKEEAKLE